VDLILRNGRACAYERDGGERTFCHHQPLVYSGTIAAPICGEPWNGRPCSLGWAFAGGCPTFGISGGFPCNSHLVNLILRICFSAHTHTEHASPKRTCTPWRARPMANECAAPSEGGGWGWGKTNPDLLKYHRCLLGTYSHWCWVLMSNIYRYSRLRGGLKTKPEARWRMYLLNILKTRSL